MMTLDPATLLIVVSFVLFLVGGLTFMAAFHAGRDRTLLWTAAGMWLACLGFLLGLIRQQTDWAAAAIIVTNMLFITGHACLWTSLNVFRGRPVAWRWLGAGALVWLLLSLWPPFMLDLGLRVTIYSIVCLGYIGAALVAVWPQRHSSQGAAWPLLSFLSLHGIFYLYRIPGGSLQQKNWLNWPDLTLLMMEALFFSICLPFGVLMMVRARAEQNYRYAALHDALTSLPNRRALFEQGGEVLVRARASHVDVAVLMCDLDWFKSVNDRFGHDAGDQVLVGFARILRQTVGAHGLCARLGGEEFVVVVDGLGSLGAQALAAQIRSGLSEQAASMPCPLTVSIGIASAQTVSYDLDHLLARADQALYAAKISGRDCVRVWPVAVSDEARAASAAVARDGGRGFDQHPVDA